MQAQSVIQGFVADSASQKIPFAAVTIVNASDSTILKGVLADDKGFFSIDNITPGNYYLLVQAVGYKKKISDVYKVDGINNVVADQFLSSSTKNLKEVNVTAQQPFIEHQADRIVVNVENSIVSAGNSVYEVLQRSPGVRIDDDGNLALKGKEGVNVMVDGKPLRLSSDQLVNYLKSMSASTVQKIDLISNPSAKYDAEGSAGIIDIRTKKGRKDGFNASVYSTYTQGRYMKSNSGFSFNMNKYKMNWYGSYDYSYRKDFYDLHLDRTFVSNGFPDTRYIQHNYVAFPYHINTGKLGMDYSLSNNTVAGFQLNAMSNRFNSSGNSNSVTLNGSDELQYYYNTLSTSDEGRDNASANLNLKHSVDTTGGNITADIDYVTYSSPIIQNFRSDYTDVNGNPFLHPGFVRSNVKAKLCIYSGKTDFVKTINGTKIESGLKSSYVTADNDKVFYNTVNGIEAIDTGKTNHFLYDETINAAYVSASRELKKFTLQIGLRFESTLVHGNQVTNAIKFRREYSQLFPNVSVLYKADDKNEISVAYNRRINRPDYQSLNPFIIYVDPTFWKQGNAYLRPELSNSYELGYSFGELLNVTAYYSHSIHNISAVLLQDDVNKLTIQTEQNMDHVNYYGMDVNLTLKVSKTWNNFTNLSYYNGSYSGRQQRQDYVNGNNVFSVNSTNSFILPYDFTSEVTFYYKTREVYNLLDFESVVLVNAGIKRSFLKNKLACKLSLNDIFYSNNTRGAVQFYNIDETFLRKRDTRTVGISLTYIIGKGGSSASAKRKSGAEDEKKRAGEKGS